MSFKKDGEIKIFKSKEGNLKTASKEKDEDLERYTVDDLVKDNEESKEEKKLDK